MIIALDKFHKVIKQKKLKQIQPVSGGGKPNTRKENKKLSQNIKKWIASGFGILK